jgi:tetratricopeptide (TPR) repeat protein
VKRGWLIAIAFACIGWASVAAAQTERLIQRYEQAARANPVDGLPVEKIWDWYRQRDQLESVIARYLSAGRNDPAAALVAGHLLKRSGRFDEAATAYQAALRLDPESPLPWRSRADLELARNHQADAAAALERAIQNISDRDSLKIDWLIELGDLWQAQSEFGKAKRAWTTAVQLAPGNIELRLQLARVSEKNHQLDDAVAHYQIVAISGSPYQKTESLREIARIERGRHQFEAAVSALEHAIQLTAPGNWVRSDLQTQLIQIYQEANRGAELEKKWQSLARANPRDLGALQQLALFYERAGRAEQECATLRQMLELMPDTIAFKSRLADLTALQGDLAEAARLYDQLVSQQPTNVDFQLARARLDVQLGHLAEAERRVRTLVQNRSPDDTVRTRVIDFLSRYRLEKAAEQVLKQAAAADPEEDTPALVQFLLRKHRFLPARIALESWLRLDSSRYAKAAEFFKEAGYPLEGEALLRLALGIEPQNRQAVEALLELLIARNDLAGARKLIEASYASATAAEWRRDLDQRLFNLLAVVDAPPITNRMSTPAVVKNAEIDTFIKALESTARRTNQSVDYLRLAIWRDWTHDGEAAVAAAQRAVELDSKNVAAREHLVDFALKTKNWYLAETQLRELAEQNPDASGNYICKLANILLDLGQVQEATVYLQRLKAMVGSNVQELADLAAAFRRASRPEEGLEIWERAYRQSIGAQRKEMLEPFVRALTEMGQPSKAARARLDFFDEQTNPSEQGMAFDALLDYCDRTKLLPWLEGEIVGRRDQHSNDCILQNCVAKVLQREGRGAEAFDLLQKAYFCAQDPTTSLRTLVGEAERTGRLAIACDYQQKLVYFAPPDDPQPLLKLAALEIADFRDPTRTWDQLIVRFPRDVDVLTQAARYFERKRSTDRVLELLLKVIDLDPDNVEALYSVGCIRQERHQFEIARSCFERVIAATTGEERAGEILRYPLPEITIGSAGYEAALRLRDWYTRGGVEDSVRVFWRANHQNRPATTDLDRRLDSVSRWIACVNDSIRGIEVRAVWLHKEIGEPTAALWAYFAAGDFGRILSLLASQLAANPRGRDLQQAYMWYAMEARQYATLRRWIDPGDPSFNEQRTLLLAVLANFLKTHPRDDLAGLIESLFPGGQGPVSALWDSARVFAACGRYGQAITLGKLAFGRAVLRKCQMANEIARWLIDTDQPERAREILAAAIQGRAEKMDEDFVSSLHALYELTPEDQRASLLDVFLQKGDGRGAANREELAAACLLGWSGQYALAERRLAQVFQQPAWAGDNTLGPIDDVGHRACQFADQTARLFLAHELQPLARFVWEKMVADRAFAQLQTDASREAIDGFRIKLAELELSAAKPSQAAEILDEIRAGDVDSLDTLRALATQLETKREFRLAALVYGRLYREAPTSASQFRTVQEMIQATGDPTLMLTLLEPIIEGTVPLPVGIDRSEVVLRLAAVYTQSGQPAHAKALLEQALRTEPGNEDYLKAFATLPDLPVGEAERAWYQLLALKPGNAEYVQGLAILCLRTGRSDEAERLIREASPAKSVAPARTEGISVGSALDQSDVAKLVQKAYQAIRESVPASVSDIAADLKRLGKPKEAVELMRSAVESAQEQNVKFFLEHRLITDFLATEDLETGRDLETLRALAVAQPNLTVGFYQALQKLAGNGLHYAKGLLESDWAAGVALAGEMMVQSYLANKDYAHAEETLRKLIDLPFLNDDALARLQTELLNEPRLAVQVIGEQIRRNKDDLRLRFALCSQLWAMGEREMVSREMNRLAHRSALQADALFQIANFCLSLKESGLAREWLETAIRNDPDQHNPELRLAFAKLLLDDGDPAKAREVLRATQVYRADKLFHRFIELVVAAGLSDEWFGEMDYLPSDVGADIWTASVNRWIDHKAYPRVLRALEARPQLAYRVFDRTAPLFEDPIFVSELSDIVEKCFDTIVLERTDAAQALRFASTLVPTPQKRVGVKVLEAVARSGTGDTAEKARLMLETEK